MCVFLQSHRCKQRMSRVEWRKRSKIEKGVTFSGRVGWDPVIKQLQTLIKAKDTCEEASAGVKREM